MSFIQFTKSIKLFRQSATTMNKGRSEKGAETETTINASWQPATEQDLLKLPEGERNRRVLKVYTDADNELLEQNDTTKVPADQLEIKGLRYEVQLVEDWTYFVGIAHYKSIVTLIEHKPGERKEYGT